MQQTNKIKQPSDPDLSVLTHNVETSLMMCALQIQTLPSAEVCSPKTVEIKHRTGGTHSKGIKKALKSDPNELKRPLREVSSEV